MNVIKMEMVVVNKSVPRTEMHGYAVVMKDLS